MTIKINELIIRAKINKNDNSSTDNTAPQSEEETSTGEVISLNKINRER
jgi:hypothetical protein|nr:MAG TPA: hypothetical protein [Caudoviricetes sp.]